MDVPSFDNPAPLLPEEEKNKMRKPVAIAITAAVAAIVAIWGTTVIIERPSQTQSSLTSKSVDVMRIMKNAKSLPEERFDAH